MSEPSEPPLGTGMAYKKLIKSKKYALILRQHSRLMRLRKSRVLDGHRLSGGRYKKRYANQSEQSMAEYFKKLNHSNDDIHTDHYINVETLVEDDFLDSDILEEEVKSVIKT